jgi:hypothetical protein
MAASLMNAREFAASLSYRVATRRHCLILLKTRSAKLRARHRYGLKQIGSLRFRFGGMFGPRTVFTGECSDPVRVVSSINKQHRSASNIAPDFRSGSSSVTSRLSWASPVVTSRRTGMPLVSTQACILVVSPSLARPISLVSPLPRNRRADGRGQWKCRSSGRRGHGCRRGPP